MRFAGSRSGGFRHEYFQNFGAFRASAIEAAAKNLPSTGCDMTDAQLHNQIIVDALQQVIDPEIGVNIVDLGLVYSVAFEAGIVRVTMTLTTPGCPMHESISWGVKNALLAIEGITDVE